MVGRISQHARVASAAGILVIVFAAGPAQAQSPAAPPRDPTPPLTQGTPPPAAAEGFVRLSPEQLANQEKLPAAPLVFSAYGFVWVALLTYVLTLWRRVSRVERELSDVSSRLKAKRP